MTFAGGPIRNQNERNLLLSQRAEEANLQHLLVTKRRAKNTYNRKGPCNINSSTPTSSNSAIDTISTNSRKLKSKTNKKKKRKKAPNCDSEEENESLSSSDSCNSESGMGCNNKNNTEISNDFVRTSGRVIMLRNYK